MDKKLKMPLDENIKFDIGDLRNVMNILLSEEGCPWDREQTLESLRIYLIEECYEVVEAINKEDDSGLCEELGDVLFQVIFQSALAEKDSKFDFSDVTDGVTRKMITRHTHIFGSDAAASSPEEVEKLWQINKEKEKKKSTPKEKFESVPKELPALIRSDKILGKAEKFIAEEMDLNKTLNETEKLLKTLESGDLSEKGHSEEIIGKILLSMVKISRYLQINAEFALTNETETFINRFEYINDTSMSNL